MERLHGFRQRYDWGHCSAIPELLGESPDGEPWAEQWLGAHPLGPTAVGDGGATLAEHIAAEPARLLGEDVMLCFGPQLPFLLKIIAPARALSLQVHPSIGQAVEGYEAEERAGIDLASPVRNYKDRNHKPEMVLALTDFEAVAGFRAPRRVAEVLAGLSSPLARRMRRTLRLAPGRFGIRQVFTDIVSVDSRPSGEEIDELVDELAARLASGASPSRRADANAVEMARAFPGDPGIAAALLLNPVTLRAGEALFVPAGSVHAYIGGLGVEIMASSDNVLRAGLTPKHIDIPEMLACVDYVAAPPVRPAPEYLSRATRAYYAPVDDFELLVTDVSLADGAVGVPGRGPRILLAIDGEFEVSTTAGRERLGRGQALFVGADERALTVEGSGSVVQADVP